MADDKKPRIDLKSRLQKMGGPAGATPPPTSVPPGPMSSRPPFPGVPVPVLSSMPPPPGVPRPPPSVSPPVLDPDNPLAALAQPFSPSQRPIAAVMAQRIEVDEVAVQQARSGARKQGLVIGLVVAALLAGVAWVGGSASAQGAAHTRGVEDAHELAGDLLKAKTTLDQLKQTLDTGAQALGKDRKYPENLGSKLAALNVDFAGDKLAGRRFSGMPAQTLHDVIDFVTRVTALNDKKDLVVSLLSRLKPTIQEELSLPPGTSPVKFVVLFDDSVDTGGTYILPLVKPLLPDPSGGIPNSLKYVNPNGGNSESPRLTDTKKILAGQSVIPVVPASFEKACPSQAKGQIAQLVATINGVISEITGQKAADASEDSKPGLSDLAQKLADDLNKVN